MPHHRHHHHGRPPRPHHGLRLSSASITRANEVLAQFFDSHVASALVDQAIEGPPEPTSQFFAAVGIADALAAALRADGGVGLRSYGARIINAASDLRDGLRIEAEAAAPLAICFPKDADTIGEALSDGPWEMCAVAVVQVLNVQLAMAVTKAKGDSA